MNELGRYCLGIIIRVYFLFKTRYFMHYLVRLREQKNGTLIMTYLDNIYFDRGRGYLKMHRWSVQNGIGPNLRRNIDSIALRDDDNISIMNTYIKHEH